MATPEPAELKAVRESIDDYETTVLGLQGFQRALTWRRGQVVPHTCSLGRRMTPTDANPVGAKDDLTPDAVLQIGESIGYVIEAKRSLPASLQYWENELSQIKKYDDDLVGWWTAHETIPTINVAILVWNRYLTDFAAFIERSLRESRDAFRRPVSLVEFSRVLEAEEVFFFRRDWGVVDDTAIAPDLTSGITVPLEVIVGAGGKPWKFYDSPPETEYVMAILWQDVFNSRLPEVEFDNRLDAWPIEVTVSELAGELQRLYGSEGAQPRERKFPTQSWIKRALDAFVKIGLADHVENERYLIRFKATLRTSDKADLFSRFFNHRSTGSPEDGAVEQLSLFGDQQQSTAT